MAQGKREWLQLQASKLMMLMLLGIASVASALKFEELAGVTPMEKVITLLEELKAQVEDEGAAEAATYKELACFCQDNQVTKQEEIDKNNENINRMESELVELKATLEELDASIKSLTEKIGQAEKEMKEIREKEHAIFEAEFADASGAVDALVKAIAHLMDAKAKTALDQTKSEVQKAMSLADAMGLEIKNQDKVNIFLQQPGPAPGAYEFQSGGIVDTLKDLQAKFEKRRDDLQTEEDAAQQSYDAAAGAKREQIEADKSTLDTENETYSETESSIATTTEELTEKKADHNDNTMYLKDITATCEMKAKEWDQRSVSRGGEITAISKALEILTGTVQGLAESTGAGGRSAPEEAAPIGLSQVDKVAKVENLEEYRDVVFTQVSSVQHQKEKASMAELRRRVITQLSAAAKDQKSLALATLVMKMARDPFAKVKVLIQKLIERLLTEARNEATHKGWCDTKIGKAEKDREYRHADSVKLNAAITEGEATIAKLKETIATLTKELEELNEALLEATKQRNQEKANNKKTLTDAKEGLTALKQAIKVLTDYYKGAAKSKNRYED